MQTSDITIILEWWVWIFLLGVIFLPLSFTIFHTFRDKGYIFAKTLGIIGITYAMFLLGTLHILSFSRPSLILLLGVPIIGSIVWAKKKHYSLSLSKIKKAVKPFLAIFFVEELFFLAGLFFLSYIRSFSPDIHGLEKYMDFGFINSAIRSSSFPPSDMWLTPFPINYYYFGHVTTAVLTVLTGIGSHITYNLMLATIFSLCLVSSFSIAGNLIASFFRSKSFFERKVFIASVLAALLVTVGGNLHALYTFFTPYQNEKPVPLWQLKFSPTTFPNSYWYPNATRYIYNTIHEFPIYSWTVADLHGHVLDIPFVLLTIAVLFSFFQKLQKTNQKMPPNARSATWEKHAYWTTWEYLYLPLIGFLLAVLYMTNAWDGIIYFLLSFFIIFSLCIKYVHFSPFRLRMSYFTQSIKENITPLIQIAYKVLFVGVSFVIFSQPLTRFFKPFVSGIGILCAPPFLTNMGKLGPFLFEANHCQHSPWWQLIVLYGFFYFFVISFLVLLWKYKKTTKADVFVLILISLSTLLLILPEFMYAKDIYPAHYRANTMFKLAFQAFMMLGLASGYIIVRVIDVLRQQSIYAFFPKKLLALYYMIFVVALLGVVFIYPYMSFNSYYGVWQKTEGYPKKELTLDGTKYLKTLYPADYEVIRWINTNIKGQPVILEAQGDSYTDYARVSANTGLPTVLGWTVHEWLWRGSYDVPSPRIADVSALYETKDVEETKKLLKKYNVQYVFLGQLEKDKYPKLYEDKFNLLGNVVYASGKTKLYKVN